MPTPLLPPPGFIPVGGSERAPVKGATAESPADPQEKIAVTLHLRSNPENAGSNLPGADYWSQNSPLKVPALSHEELAAGIASSKEDINAVTAYLESKGLAVMEVSAVKRTIRAEGTVAQMEDAFAVKLYMYRAGSLLYRGREGAVHLPEQISGIVEAVFGLDNRPVAQRNITAAAPPGTQVLTPLQAAQLYNFPTGIDASGQTVGILEFSGGYAAADIIAYCNGLGIKPPVIKADVNISPASNTPAGNAGNVSLDDTDFEVALDMEVIAAVAPGVNIVVYFADNSEDGWVNAFNTAVWDTVNNPSVISVSWGTTETKWTKSARDKIHGFFVQAASLHKTILVATGDNGTDDGNQDGLAHVQFPASDPYITACGGTVMHNVNPPGFGEDAWNDDAGASGGGISVVFTQVPPWQTGINKQPSVNPGHATGRGIPDIAGNASPYSGYYLFMYGQSTQTLLITAGAGAGSAYGAEGGTSAVAPLYAGLVALLNAALGQPVGYLNPTLYKLAGSAVFNQVVTGDNAYNGAPGYKAGPGWNACTGLGSLNGMALLQALHQVSLA